ncbi:MAG: DUF3793 family protein [Oscillospiraceae bacterium]|nr:DUF3793 family protein [Oscillospiraceae bacterium]
MTSRNLESELIEYCAPTLMGIKPAGLFRYHAQSLELLRRMVSSWTETLTPYGLELRILKTKTGDCLIYLYRTQWLRRILSDGAVRIFLERMGYQVVRDPPDLLEQLSQRLCMEQDFPHEIGVFLGYPLEDVEGFIQNGGRNYSCCGCWKSYGDPEKAEALFASYRQCTALCKKWYQNGYTITQLIAA